MKKSNEPNDMDEFEQRVSRQPLRQIPAEWRGEILAAALTPATLRPASRASLLSNIRAQLSAILWPCPEAWAGLAVIWIIVFALNYSMQDRVPVMAKKAPSPSPQMVAELKQQQQMFAELIGPAQLRDAERPKLVPLPRSERIEFMAA
jgi:hypothetical protein